MKRSFRPLAVLGAVALAATVAAVPATSASATVVGSATLSQLSGGVDTPLSLTTSGPCSAPATKVRAIVSGFGFSVTPPVVAYAPQTFGFSTSAPMTLPLSNAFRIYAQNNGNTALVGRYDLKVQCVNGIGTTIYDEFATAMIWTTPGNSFANIDSATFAPPPAPANTTDPTLTGETRAGATLTCNQGTWTDAFSYAREWLRDGVVIDGATGTTRVSTVDDVSKTITCRVTATNGGSSANETTNGIVVTLPPAPVNTVDPTLTGTAKVGSTLTCNTGTWTDADSYTREWLRDAVVIVGSTGATRVSTVEDLTQTITCKVTATNIGGSVGEATTGVVIAAGTFATSVAPTVTGTAKVGATVSAAKGTWSPAPATYAYQWLRSGAVIGGATKPTYSVVAADKGKALSVRVTVTKPGFTTTAKVSAGKVVAPGTLKAVKAPGLSGKAKVGKKLTATKGTWSPAPATYSYQWQRAGKNIKGATKATYKVTKKDRTKKLRVKVTVTKTGYTTAIAYSATKKAS